MTALPSKDEAYCLAVAWEAAQPRRQRSGSEWADAERILTSKQSGEPGQWRTSRNPLTREIMDCMTGNSRVEEMVLMTSAQIFKTEVLLNILGCNMTESPAPMMMMTPTIENTIAWKAQKLNPMMTDTPIVRDLLGGNRSRDAANRQDMVDFPGGLLFLAGGNSPNSYAQRSVKVLVMDDLDRFPPTVGKEGDPVFLARQRTKAFPRTKRIVLASTPLVKDTSLIYREYQNSDQRRAYLPCPHCNHFQPLEWGASDGEGNPSPHGIKWNATLTEAWYVCRNPECGGCIFEHHKPRMLANHRWIAENPGHPRRGYHAGTLYCSIGLGPSWLDLAKEWVEAIKSVTTLQAFINTNLGEPWEEKGVEVDATGLLARLEEYPDNLPILAKTAGVDVQKDRLEVTFDGWGLGEENWTIDHHILPGDTAQPDVWKDLGELLKDFAPDACGIDSGYNTSMVYDFVKPRKWCYALKGMDGRGRPIVEDEKKRKQRLRKQRKKGIQVEIVGDDQAKSLIFSRLQLQSPGPGYIHFPRDPDFDDEYFDQLTAEKLKTVIRGTRPIQVWVQTRPRNETLDCKKMSLAALRLSGINLEARAKARAFKTEQQQAEPTKVLPKQKRYPGGFVKGWKR